MNIKQFLQEDKPNVDAMKDPQLSAAFKEALKQAKKAKPNEDEITKTLNNTGEAYNRLKNYEQALKYFNFIVEMKLAAIEMRHSSSSDEGEDRD